MHNREKILLRAVIRILRINKLASFIIYNKIYVEYPFFFSHKTHKKINEHKRKWRSLPHISCAMSFSKSSRPHR
jgi:uncharacterized membrane protein